MFQPPPARARVGGERGARPPCGPRRAARPSYCWTCRARRAGSRDTARQGSPPPSGARATRSSSPLPPTTRASTRSGMHTPWAFDVSSSYILKLHRGIWMLLMVRLREVCQRSTSPAVAERLSWTRTPEPCSHPSTEASGEETGEVRHRHVLETITVDSLHLW